MSKGGGAFGGRRNRTGIKGLTSLNLSEKANNFSQFVRNLTGYAPAEKETPRYVNFLKKIATSKRMPMPLARLFWGVIGKYYIYTYMPEARVAVINLMEKCNILKPDSRIASFGAATGLFELYLSKSIGPQGKIIAVDFSGSLSRLGKKFAKKSGILNVEFVRALAEETKLPSNSQDIVMCAFTPFPFDIKLWPKVLTEVKRLLDNKKTSYLVLANMVSYENRLITYLIHSIERNGFKRAEAHIFGFPKKPKELLLLAIFKKPKVV